MNISIQTFGYKHGAPPEDVQLLLDARPLSNPYWVEGLREKNGKTEEVQTYFRKTGELFEVVSELLPLIESMSNLEKKKGTTTYKVGIGCTGGFHRSVAMAENLASRLTEDGFDISVVTHRDILKS